MITVPLLDPWASIDPPDAASAISARRVSAENRWDFFWARDLHGRHLLALSFDADLAIGRLPKPVGIEVSVRPANEPTHSIYVLTLVEAAHKDIFYRLCLDIISAAEAQNSEAAAVAVAVSRTWRWHHLLRGGHAAGLSIEEQKGLIGELLVLERHVLTTTDAPSAVEAWVGPLGAPKDFEMGAVCIEAKARRGTATPFVSISSEFQLDASGTEAFFMHVVDLATAQPDSPKSFTVTELAARVRADVELRDPSALEHLESMLSAAGFLWDDDYSSSCWVETGSSLYEIVDQFPRIDAASVPMGVSGVKYKLELAACTPYKTDYERIGAAMGKGASGV